MNVTEINGIFHCDCGFSWAKGKSGSHNCADGLRKILRQLAVENMALNSFIVDACWIVDDGQYCDATDFMPETPATDRIVAEAEARGVEKFAAEQRGVAERLKKRGGDVVTSSVKFCLSSAEEAEDFAKQLREGADK
ncbi:hypothetical protein [Klebsiella quasivariicola]|uniref:hypothetical protein n=1 Tax=Klebsiella quasivariicola TaxID=2026240 RepID=UPI002478493F|nr:hypothetical protein [Klebsiella quasivariicola]